MTDTTVEKAEVRDRYTRDGFVVLPGLLSGDEVDSLIDEATRICRGERGDVPGLLPQVDDSDEAVLGRYDSIAFPHKVSPLVRDVMRHPAIVGVLQRLIGTNVKCVQSYLFLKRHGQPGQSWHQDEWFIPTRDRSLCSAWIAFDDVTVENGCLWEIPGSHRPGVLWPMRAHNNPEFGQHSGAQEAYGFPYSVDDAVPLEVAAGGVVFHHGYTLHMSRPNRVPGRYRRALAYHYMSAESWLPWDWDGYITPRPADNRDITIVAGEDPYAARGTDSLMFAMVRPNGSPDPRADVFERGQSRGTR
jgi:hypothetical protein